MRTPRHHIIISGTGRAGTTFLVQLLTTLELDTGFHKDHLPILKNCNAGLEFDILQESAPYIVKNPWLCDYIQDVLLRSDIVIDHAFIPIRDLQAAAKSRIHVTRNSDPTAFPEGVPGGLWHTSDPDKQEEILACQLYKLIYYLSKFGIPLTLIHYPRLTQDPVYLYEKLLPLLKNIRYSTFLQEFHAVVQPELVHQSWNLQPISTPQDQVMSYIDSSTQLFEIRPLNGMVASAERGNHHHVDYTSTEDLKQNHASDPGIEVEAIVGVDSIQGAQLHPLITELHREQENLATIQNKLQELRADKQRLKHKVARLQSRLAGFEAEVAAMQSSKFWKLRKQWIRLKQVLGLKSSH